MDASVIGGQVVAGRSTGDVGPAQERQSRRIALRVLVTVALAASVILLSWTPRYIIPSVALFSALSVLFLSGALLPTLARALPRSLAMVIIVGIQALVWVPAVSDEPWLAGVVALPALCVLALVFLVEMRTWRSRRKGLKVPPRWWTMIVNCLGTLVLFVWASMTLWADGWWFDCPEVWTAAIAGVALVALAPTVIIVGTLVRSTDTKHNTWLTVILFLALGLVTTSASAWWSINEPEPPPLTPMGLAHELRWHLDIFYPHWETSPRDLDSLWQGYLPGMLSAAQDCSAASEPCRPVLRVLRDLFADLDNGHTAVFLPDDVGLPPISTRKVGDGVAITWVDPEFHDDSCDIAEGDEVVAVDGMDVTSAAQMAPSWAIARASSATREHYAFRKMLRGAPGTTVTVSVRNASGGRCDTVLMRESGVDLWNAQNDPSFEHFIETELMDDGVGYLYVEGFGESDAGRLMEAMDEIKDTPGLILDLRGNPGGTVAVADELVGRFFATATHLGENCQVWCYDEECFDECEQRWVDPVGPTYDGVVAVLIDEEVASAAEFATYALCRVGDARCFGRTTSGETDFVVSWEIPGATVAISSARFDPSVGPEIQGFGVVPHEEVALRLDDLRSERDPVLDAARLWILESIDPRPVDVATSRRMRQ